MTGSSEILRTCVESCDSRLHLLLAIAGQHWQSGDHSASVCVDPIVVAEERAPLAAIERRNWHLVTRPSWLCAATAFQVSPASNDAYE
jgi:hypothetical protein